MKTTTRTPAIYLPAEARDKTTREIRHGNVTVTIDESLPTNMQVHVSVAGGAQNMYASIGDAYSLECCLKVRRDEETERAAAQLAAAFDANRNGGTDRLMAAVNGGGA